MEQDRRMDVSSGAVGSLVERHLPLVRSLARRYSGSGELLEDLVQVGSVGLVAAARRFDPARGIPFAAFATATIDGELRRHLRDRTATIRVPRKQQEHRSRLRRAGQEVAQERGHEATLAEAADAAGIALDDAEIALKGPSVIVPLSTLEPLRSEAADDELAACEDRELVRELFASLEPRERQLVRLRYGGDLSQAEIGRRLDISQSQASRLLASALEKLRAVAQPGNSEAA
jgi:RNA polymerase sigma-B factor